MKVDVLLGLQWGDEGKGKVVDVLTPKYDVVARFRTECRSYAGIQGREICAPFHPFGNFPRRKGERNR